MTHHASHITHHILFICTGNICRSPMAQVLLQNRYKHESRITNHELRISSAGLNGLDGQPAHPLAQQIVNNHGVDLTTHRARTITPDLLLNADMILTMESHHRQWILEKMPTLEQKTHLLGRWRDLEITDPMGGDESEFRETFKQVQTCLDDWLPLLPIPATSRTHHESPITHHE